MEQMREKYESLSAFVLKDLAKARGIKGVSSLKKGQIIERMLEEDAKEAEEAEKNGTAEERANSFKDDYAALDSGSAVIIICREIMISMWHLRRYAASI